MDANRKEFVGFAWISDFELRALRFLLLASER